MTTRSVPQRAPPPPLSPPPKECATAPTQPHTRKVRDPPGDDERVGRCDGPGARRADGGVARGRWVGGHDEAAQVQRDGDARAQPGRPQRREQPHEPAPADQGPPRDALEQGRRAAGPRCGAAGRCGGGGAGVRVGGQRGPVHRVGISRGAGAGDWGAEGGVRPWPAARKVGSEGRRSCGRARAPHVRTAPRHRRRCGLHRTRMTRTREYFAKDGASKIYSFRAINLCLDVILRGSSVAQHSFRLSLDGCCDSWR